MTTRARSFARMLLTAILAAGLWMPISAAPRQAVPRSGGYRAAPSHPTRSPATRAPVPARGQVAPRGTANGVAHYGYHSGSVGWGYPGWCYPGWGWGWGWSGWWGWGWPGYYGYYGYYGPYWGDAYYAAAPPPPQGPAVIETDVVPGKAEVWLDGESVGFADDYDGRWDRLTIAPGRHVVEFKKSGYRTLVVDLDAGPGMHYAFDDTLAKGEGEEHRTLAPPQSPSPSDPPQESAQPSARLAVRAMPADAAIYLDGTYLGLASELSNLHGAIGVARGSHRLEAVRPGFLSAVRTVEVQGPDVEVVEFNLEPSR